MRLCLFQPDIPQNTGTLMRLAVCMGVPLDIVEPCGFALTDKNLKRAGMDYVQSLDLTRHVNWESLCNTQGRRVLLTTKADIPYTELKFLPDDILILGSESSGAPDFVHDSCPMRIRVPMAPEQRSLNVAIAGAMVLAEALRQCNLFPQPGNKT